MSNVYPYIVKCALCGTEGAQRAIACSSSDGAELDGRPIGTHRNTMECWVQMCSNPDCGYCASDISKELPGARDCVRSDDYRSHLHGNMRDLIKRFYCAALVFLSATDPKGAFECFRNAAWVCDDLKLDSDARAFRMLAAQLFPAGHEPVWLADLLRRSGNHHQALSACNSFLRQTGVNDWSKKLLEFEKNLVLARDAGPHSTDEIAPIPQPSPQDLNVSVLNKTDPKNFDVSESGLGEEFKALPGDIQDALCEGPELPR